MPHPSPRSVVERAAHELAAALVTNPPAGGVRVTAVVGGVACMVLAWPATEEMMPTLARRRVGERSRCKADAVAALRAAGSPKKTTWFVTALKGRHGKGTVVKALAELTEERVFVNPRDRRGYRLPEWVGGPGTLFPVGQ